VTRSNKNKSFSLKRVHTSAAEEIAVHHDVLFIYIPSEPTNVNVVVDYVYKQYSNLYKLTFFQRNKVI